MPSPEQPVPRKRPRLRLPFENRREDAGTWAYDHRVGLAVTLIVYLLVAIVFVAGKIVVGGRGASQEILFDPGILAELETERLRLEEEVKARQREADPIDWRSVSNQTSNENVLNEQLKDDRGTRTAELNAAAVDVEARMRANRESYEQGLAEERAIWEAKQGSETGEERRDRKVAGNVTVRLDVKDPVRHSRHLPVPAYRCEGGGEVVVSITVDRAGDVVAARVVSGGDEPMREAALQAARNSRVNIDESAPARQTGTITYVFVPQ